MDAQLDPTSSGSVQNTTDTFATVPNGSEPFRTIPNHAENFGSVPNPSESFGSVPNRSETGALAFEPIASRRPDNIEAYTMTVREAARVFEAAGVARTERSIINWCQPNRQGIARLDAFFDENAHKYYLTPQSVERAVEEELAKARAAGTPLPNPAEVQAPGAEPVPKRAEAEDLPRKGSGRWEELERENRDLQITTRAKDYFIEQLQQDRDAFAKERGALIDKLVASSERIGVLETKLLQLERPGEVRKVHVVAGEGAGSDQLD
ncbi:conserved hypothetical protein [uncultured Defluviicoccus sp.]|uniref:Uncharacterized protein n=1 Tax=metagenome TaxID=256318 RepID=A0A380TM47_9ZZZZ|nr:conserved hypothetical protein [uncultured Defluviicoccus sp.]